MRKALTDLLDSVGCEAAAFESGEQFLTSGVVDACRVVITDIQMSKIDGLSLLDHLREVWQTPLPVIVITALTDRGLEHRALAKGCYAFLHKPFNPEILIDHVRGALARED